jgi:predicted RNA-binding protein YlxR (DUF448 family)
MRRCRVCRTPQLQSELQRWTFDGLQVVADTVKRAPGRGYYSCSQRCAEILPKTIKHKQKA